MVDSAPPHTWFSGRQHVSQVLVAALESRAPALDLDATHSGASDGRPERTEPHRVAGGVERGLEMGAAGGYGIGHHAIELRQGPAHPLREPRMIPDHAGRHPAPSDVARLLVGSPLHVDGIELVLVWIEGMVRRPEHQVVHQVRGEGDESQAVLAFVGTEQTAAEHQLEADVALQ